MRTREPRAQRGPRLSQLVRAGYGRSRAADPLVVGVLEAVERSVERLMALPMDLTAAPPDREPGPATGADPSRASGAGRRRPRRGKAETRGSDVPPGQTPLDPAEAGVVELAAAIRSGRLRSAELVEALLEQADRIDGALGAWETLDRRGALAAARRADRAIERRGGPSETRPLQGVPIGVKDVIAVRGLPLTAGFVPFRDRISRVDATVVARLREAGAIPLGTMVTTQFAAWHPARTANPWSLGRTPGGSSSGPAAGVAARLVPAAIGSQTAGSVLRPAAFCGIVGFKPTRGRISTEGVLPLAWSLDHVGFLARSVRDCRLLLGCASETGIGSRRLRHAAGDAGGLDGPSSPVCPPPRIALVEDAVERASPPVAEAVRDVAARAAASGASVLSMRLGSALDLAIESQRLIMFSEAGALHGELLAAQPGEYAARTRAALEVGSVLPAAVYVRAQRVRGLIREAWSGALGGIDALLLPTVTTVAPDRATTGDFSLQAPASLLGLPAISLPARLDEDGLPIGVQLVGQRGADESLLATAGWLEALLEPLPRPPMAAPSAAPTGGRP